MTDVFLNVEFLKAKTWAFLDIRVFSIKQAVWGSKAGDFLEENENSLGF